MLETYRCIPCQILVVWRMAGVESKAAWMKMAFSTGPRSVRDLGHTDVGGHASIGLSLNDLGYLIPAPVLLRRRLAYCRLFYQFTYFKSSTKGLQLVSPSSTLICARMGELPLHQISVQHELLSPLTFSRYLSSVRDDVKAVPVDSTMRDRCS